MKKEYNVEYCTNDGGGFATDTFICENAEELACKLVSERGDCGAGFEWDYASVECDGALFVVASDGEVA